MLQFPMFPAVQGTKPGALPGEAAEGPMGALGAPGGDAALPLDFAEQLENVIATLPPELAGLIEQYRRDGMSLPEAAKTVLFAAQRAGVPLFAPPQGALPEAVPGAALPALELPVADSVLPGVVERAALQVQQARLPGEALLAVPLAGSNDKAPEGFAALLNQLPMAQAAGLPRPDGPGFTGPLTGNLLGMGVPQQVGSPNWGQAVGERLMWMVQGDRQFAELKLNPPNLGPLEIRVNVSQEQASVQFLANHAAVREALEAAMPRLREMLDQQNIQLVDVDVRDRAPDGQRASDGSGEHASGHASGGPEFASGTDDEPVENAILNRGLGLVDLFA